MKKRILTAVLSVAMIASLAACTGTTPAPAADDGGAAPAPAADDGGAAPAPAPSASGKTVINIYAFSDEVPKMFTKYLEVFPELAEKYEANSTIISETDGAYQPALDQALAGGAATAPDVYAAEAAYILKYTQGDASAYAATYKDLGIDVDGLISAGDIAQYSVDIGTNPSGDVVALGYQATGGAFIYRSSLAIDTWGTDAAADISAKIGPGWDKFFAAAAELKAKGYGIVSGDGDVWHAVENSSSTGWVVDGKLSISPEREAFFDLSKQLMDGGYHNDTQDWTEAWYGDMKGVGAQPIFGFFGPAWLINYTIAPNCGGTAPGEGTWGDWRVCDPTIGFFWGGTWLLSAKDSVNKEAAGDFIEWVTLDTSDKGLQYFWANGTMVDGEVGTKDTVASGVVMAKSNGDMEFLGGQNMFDTFVPANQFAKGDNLTQYDNSINGYFRDAVRQYTAGTATKEDALVWFKQQVADNLDVVVE
jgi:ABC-type glycerol-3-phosphate transport system substrate-binding protein